MQRDQLALLLGIVQQCPFDAVGLVHRSVALGSLYGGAGRLFHLEVQLHQALLTELAESAGQVELRRSLPLPGCGLLQLQERLVEVIASGFIRQTRFDPRRKAATEQQLYDALPDTLRTLRQEGEINLASAVCSPGTRCWWTRWLPCCPGWRHSCRRCRSWSATPCNRRWNSTRTGWCSAARP
jgi:hypothetical protein